MLNGAKFGQPETTNLETDMKTLLIAIAFAAIASTSAFAQNVNSNANTSNAGATSGSNITFNSPSEQTIRSAPGVVAPGLTSSAVETCLGSASAGGSGLGFGFSFGTTTLDVGCEARLDAKIIAQLGDSSSAKERLCAQPQIAAAYARGGHPCLGAAPINVSVGGTPGQPLIRMKVSDMPSGAVYRDRQGRLHTKP